MGNAGSVSACYGAERNSACCSRAVRSIHAGSNKSDRAVLFDTMSISER